MATTNKLFIPASWDPDSIAVSASSQPLALTGITKSEDCVRVFNNTSETIFINFTAGAGTVALTSGMPIGVGQAEPFGIAPDVTHVNVIGTGATGTIYFNVGKGM